VTATEKLARLREMLSALDAAVVAYSGGADSAFLADVAHEVLGDRAEAVTAVSPSLAPAERARARALARSRGWRHREVETAELERPAYRRNGPDRCYHCKTELFDVLAAVAPGRAILVGTNADDVHDVRPGHRAAVERGVRAPLLEAGLTKAEIRSLSRERGLETWDKPAAPCLASRIAHGVEVTPERLERVARAEAFLASLGLRVLRVRDHGDLARIEVPVAEVARLAADGVRERVASVLRRLGFRYVTLDLDGFRSGSMNVVEIGRRAPGGDGRSTVGEA
jgi:uncharacterized protein